jgi:DNA polymerase III epsilon subunit-like protein
VLKPAFERVGNEKAIPKEERWRCTLKLAKQKLKLHFWHLDGVVESCDINPRDEDDKHDASIDAQLAGEAYMSLVKMVDLQTSKLGFCTK